MKFRARLRESFWTQSNADMRFFCISLETLLVCHSSASSVTGDLAGYRTSSARFADSSLREEAFLETLPL